MPRTKSEVGRVGVARPVSEPTLQCSSHAALRGKSFVATCLLVFAPAVPYRIHAEPGLDPTIAILSQSKQHIWVLEYRIIMLCIYIYIYIYICIYTCIYTHITCIHILQSTVLHMYTYLIGRCGGSPAAPGPCWRPKRKGGYRRLRYCCLESLDRELLV